LENVLFFGSFGICLDYYHLAMKDSTFPLVFDLRSNSHHSVHPATRKAVACVGDSSVISPPTKLQLARIIYFAEQVGLAKAKILPAIQANSGRTCFLPF
jgi:hypothetical protein